MDTLADFDKKIFRFGDRTKTVLKTGSAGPGVILIHEVYGFTEHQARLARWIRDAGFVVYSPILFGKPDARNPEAQSLGRLVHLCVSREIYLFAAGRSSPVVDWLKRLAREVLSECGGAGVGVIGMCLTGGFALSMAVDAAVLCAVVAEPGLPAHRAGAVDVSRHELAVIRRRIDAGEVNVRGYRFEGDTICRRERFDTLSRELGPGFAAVTLPDRAANPTSPMQRVGKPPHSVLTGDLIDAPEEPTRQAVDAIIAVFHGRLRAAHDAASE